MGFRETTHGECGAHGCSSFRGSRFSSFGVGETELAGHQEIPFPQSSTSINNP